MGLQIKEYGKVMFARDYNPHKITKMKKFKNLTYSEISFISTLIGSFIVLLPYLAFFFIKLKQNFSASIISLVISLIILAYIGGYSIENKKERIKEGVKTAGIGLMIALVSAAIGILINTFI